MPPYILELLKLLVLVQQAEELGSKVTQRKPDDFGLTAQWTEYFQEGIQGKRKWKQIIELEIVSEAFS